MHQEMVQAAALIVLNTPESLEEAIGLLRRAVYAFSLRICHRREDAEDATQEVLSRSLRHLARFHDPDELAVWLYVVTRNQFRLAHRRSLGHPSKAISLDALPLNLNKTVSLLSDLRSSPEATLLRLEEAMILRRAVLRIPAPLRSVLVLHDLEEFSTSEIAKILALKQGTIRVRLHRARLRVRNEIAAILPGCVSGNAYHSCL